LINGSQGVLARLPAPPVVVLTDDKVELEWPCTNSDFEGFHVYRRTSGDEAEKLTDEPVLCVEGVGRYEDTTLPENSDETHYYVTSLFMGEESLPGPEVALVLATSEATINIPSHTRLLAIYPNPFNPETHISFEMAKPGRVPIRIYDVGGRLVRWWTIIMLPAAMRRPGMAETTWVVLC